MFNRLGIGDTITKLGTITNGVQDVNLKTQLTAVQTEFSQHMQEMQTQNDSLTANLSQSKSDFAVAQDKLNQATQQVAERDARIGDLQKQLGAISTQVSTASPEAIATSFQSVIENLQAKAKLSPSGVGTTVKSMQIEVKGIVQVQGGQAPVMVFPGLGAAVDPATYSTLRVEYAAVPTLGAATGSPVPVPPAPAPVPPPAPPPR